MFVESVMERAPRFTIVEVRAVEHIVLYSSCTEYIIVPTILCTVIIQHIVHGYTLHSVLTNFITSELYTPLLQEILNFTLFELIL